MFAIARPMEPRPYWMNQVSVGDLIIRGIVDIPSQFETFWIVVIMVYLVGGGGG